MNRTVAAAPHVRRLGLVVASASLAVIGFETLLPEPGAAVGSHFCLLCGYVGGVNSVLNVLLFVPLGVGLALAGVAGRRALLAMSALSVFIETAQFLLIRGRYSTVGDVITNSIGGAMGFALGLHALNLLRPQPRTALILTTIWSAVWLGVEAVSAFGFSPSLPRAEYYGQIAPRIGNLEPFQGRVLRASIGDVIVADERMERSGEVRELLLRGAMVTSTVAAPLAPSTGVAAIVRVVDSSQREIMLMGQAGSDFLFGVRAGASTLRLRPPIFALPNVLQALQEGDKGRFPATLTLRARYSSRGAWFETEPGTANEHRIPIAASLGWTMLLPFQWLIEGTRVERFLSVLWIACLLLPIGYWGAGAAQFLRSQHPAAALLAIPIAAGLVSAGLTVVPLAFGLAAAAPTDWVAAFVGIGSGAALYLITLRGQRRFTALDYRRGELA